MSLPLCIFLCTVIESLINFEIFSISENGEDRVFKFFLQAQYACIVGSIVRCHGGGEAK